MNMNDTVFEEAKRCPKCKTPGTPTTILPAPNGNGKIHFFECEVKNCRNFERGAWMVQVDRTGAIPVRDRSRGDKDFPILDTRVLNRASSLLDEAEHPPENNGRPEIENPWSPT
jgi:hypothetical protein